MKCIRKDQAFLWKSEMLDGISLFKAQFHQFVYSKHTHNEFAIGVIEHGAQRFHHKGMWVIPLPIAEITLAVLAINLHYVLIGTSLHPIFYGKNDMFRLIIWMSIIPPLPLLVISRRCYALSNHIHESL